MRGGDIGEFVLTCPVFAALRGQFPAIGIEVLGYPRIAQVAKAAGLVDEVRSIESRAAAGFFARGAPLDPDLAGYFARFSVIFSYLYDPDCHFQANVLKVSTAQFIAGPARPSEGQSTHAADAFLKPLERLAIFGAPATPRLRFPGRGAAREGAWIAVHPGAGNLARTWPDSRWRALLQSIIAKTSYRLLLVGGDSENRALSGLAQALPPERVAVLDNPGLAELGMELAGCHAFIGHDSGISHLAAATGLPCVTVWGTANAAVWQPLGQNVTLLKSRSGTVGVTLEEVISALPLVWSGAE